jgi:hypothetical protein
VRTNMKMAIGGTGAAALVLAFAGPPLLAGAADHLDAPGLTAPSGRADADITDVYAFQGRNARNTVLVLNTGPGAGAIAPLDYGTDVRYIVSVDRTGDAKRDLAYVFRFGKGNGTGAGQAYTVTKYMGASARSLTNGMKVASGRTGMAKGFGGSSRVFAGLRSDPFFFDLDAFTGAVGGSGNGRTFCDAKKTDFFAPLNVNSIVLEVPDSALGKKIGVWGMTMTPDGRVDRMGRPAINTVFNKGEDKNSFNRTLPASDPMLYRANVVGTLKALGGYTDKAAGALADVLLPDVLTYDTRTAAAGPLNGRALADDVIDAELGIVTQGAVKGDCVAPHSDYIASFPYLGAPH